MRRGSKENNLLSGFAERAAINRKSTDERNRQAAVSRTARRRTMDDADLLRNHATRLFALAEKARQKGHPDYADELTSLAREVVRHAVMIERRFRTHAA